MLTFSPPVAGWQPVSGWPTLGPVARRPFQRGAWQGRVESRSPRPLLPLLFAMPGAPLDSSHFAQHARTVPSADPSFHCNARNSLLAGGGAECHANKIPRSGCWATEEGAAQPVAKGGAGALQERELGAVGLRQDVRASVFTENCKVQVAQRTPGRRNTLQVGAGRAGKAGSRIRRKGATGGLEAGWQAPAIGC